MGKKAVILLSGGLDSATCLGLAKAEGYSCYTLSVDYGQRHKAELHAARRVANWFGVNEHKVISVNLNAIGGSALTDDKIDIPDYSDSEDIPVTYVPARNTLFLSLALGYAEVIGAESIYIGVNSVDYSGYPDCRPEYIAAFQKMACLATKEGVEGNPVKIKTPLLHLSKADIIRSGTDIGVDYSLTVTCYRATDHGHACGKCDCCVLRKKGFENAGILDATLYV